MGVDETTLHLSHLVSTLAEDTIFVLAGDERVVSDPPFAIRAFARHAGLPLTDVEAARADVLGITWAAALREDPAMGRQALLRARFERVAADLDTDGREARTLTSGWMTDVLTTQARALVTPAPDPAAQKAH